MPGFYFVQTLLYRILGVFRFTLRPGFGTAQTFLRLARWPPAFGHRSWRKHTQRLRLAGQGTGAHQQQQDRDAGLSHDAIFRRQISFLHYLIEKPSAPRRVCLVA
jgi:hypothetical protein